MKNELISQIKLNSDSYLSLSEQLARYIRHWIIIGEFQPGEKLPTAADWAARIGVAYKTAHGALALLETENLIVRKRHKGSFVAMPKAAPETELRGRRIILLFADEERQRYPFFREVMTGVRMALAETDVELLTQPWPAKPEELKHCHGILLDKEGMITAEVIPFLKALTIPVVVLNSHLLEHLPNIPVVLPEYANDTRRLVRLLLKSGCRDIAFFQRSARGDFALFSERQKTYGFQTALAEEKIPFREDRVFDSLDSSVESCRRAVERLKKDLPQAIFCCDDLIAYFTIRMLREAGISVPDDVSVTGFYDFEAAELERPFITTVRIPAAEIGRVGAGTLLKRIAGSQVENTVLYSGQLIQRDSVKGN